MLKFHVSESIDISERFLTDLLKKDVKTNHHNQALHLSYFYRIITMPLSCLSLSFFHEFFFAHFFSQAFIAFYLIECILIKCKYVSPFSESCITFPNRKLCPIPKSSHTVHSLISLSITSLHFLSVCYSPVFSSNASIVSTLAAILCHFLKSPKSVCFMIRFLNVSGISP